MEYGYLDEFGHLHCREAKEQDEYYTDENGEQQCRVISAHEVAEVLSANGWKPVEPIDEAQLVCAEGYVVRLVPYDAGDRIAYRYDKKVDRKKFLSEIERLKNELAASDYKVTKSYEASLAGEEPPYDMAALHSERQALRDQINDLENTMQFFLSQCV